MSREVICPHCLRSVPVDSDGSIPTIASLDDIRTAEFLIPPTISGDLDETTLAGSPPVPSMNGDKTLEDWPLEPRASASGSGLLDNPVADPALAAFAPPDSLTTSRSVDSQEIPPATAWGSVLLRSYASAATLGLVYLLWTGRGATVATLPGRPELAPASDAERVRDLRPLPPDRRTALGRGITVGALEIIPLGVARQPVRLIAARRPGERSASVLVLRIRCKNLGGEGVFTPLEPAFVRASDSGPSDTVIRTEAAPIEAFPLAVASEKSIEGQSFAPLAPGESRETILASEPVEPERIAGRMTWRFRVRVDARQTTLIGVDFEPGDVR